MPTTLCSEQGSDLMKAGLSEVSESASRKGQDSERTPGGAPGALWLWLKA